jgi:hypothetical protein
LALIRARIFIAFFHRLLSFIVTDETLVSSWPMKLAVSSVTDETQLSFIRDRWLTSFIVTDETNTLTFIFGRELSRYSHSFHSLTTGLGWKLLCSTYSVTSRDTNCRYVRVKQ